MANEKERLSEIQKLTADYAKSKRDILAVERELEDVSDSITKSSRETLDLTKQIQSKTKEIYRYEVDRTSLMNRMKSDLTAMRADRKAIKSDLAEEMVMEKLAKEGLAVFDGHEKAHLQSILSDIKRKMTDTKKLIELEERLEKLKLEKRWGPLQKVALGVGEKIGDGYKRMGELFSAMTSAASGWAAVMGLGLDRFIELDTAAGDFRKKTGLMRSQMGGIADSAREINLEYADFGINIKEAFAAAAELQAVFQTTALESSKNTKLVALLAANIGVAGEDSAKVVQLFNSLSKAAGTTSSDISNVAISLAKSAGVPVKQVFEDMARASEDTLKFLGKNPMELVRTAVAARLAGTSLESMAKSARQLLNFQDSINSEMEASALLGKSVNFQLARQLAFEGDIEGSRKAAMKQLKDIGDFSKLNLYQQEALSKVSGMTVKEIIEQQNQEKMLAAVRTSGTADQVAMLQEYEKSNSRIKNGITDTDAKRGAAWLKDKQRQTQMENINNSLKSILTSISDLLLPIGLIILPGIADAVSWIAKGFQLFFKPLKDIRDYTDEIFNSWSEKGKETMSMIGKIIRAIVGVGAAVIAFKAIKGGLFGDIFGKAGSAGGGIAKSMAGIGKSVGNSFAGMVQGIGKGIKFLGDPLVMRGAVSMVIMAGSLWILGKALHNFVGLDLSALGMAAAAIGLVAGAAAIIGIPAVAALVGTGAVVLGLLGLALVPFAYAAKLAGEAMIPLSVGFEAMIRPLKSLGDSAKDLWLASGGIYAISAALGSFGIGAGVGSIIGKLTGGDGLVDKLITLGSLSSQLMETATALERIAAAVQKLSDIPDIDVGKLNEISKAAVKDNSQSEKVDVLGKKLDNILDALVGGKVSVYMDGRLVSKQLTNYGR